MTRRTILAILAATLACQTLPAEEIKLSNNFVTSVTTDREGRIWAGTDEGLNCFDGIGVKSYFRHTNGLGGNQINYILADRTRPIIWVASRHGGLSLCNCETGVIKVFDTIIGDATSLENNDINYIDQDEDGNIWASSFAKGIDRLDFETGRFTHFNSTTHPGFGTKTICVFKVRDGKLYIGHWDSGLSIVPLDGGAVREFTHSSDPGSLLSDEVRSLFFDDYGNLWIGTTAGLSFFSESGGNFVNFRHEEGVASSLPKGTVYDIRMRDKDRLLVATDGGGVCELDLRDALFKSGRRKFTPVLLTDQPSNIPARSIAVDAYGNLWVGSYGNGLLFKSGGSNGIRSLRYPYALSGAVITALTYGPGGELIYGTGSRVNMTGNGDSIYAKKDFTLPGAILALMCDSDGRIWTASAENGIDVLDRNGGRKSAGCGAYGANTRVLLEDGNFVWAGTDLGLLKLERKSGKLVRRFSKDDILEDNLVRALAKDPKGRLWVGTYGRGLFVFDENMVLQFSYTTGSRLPSMSVNHLLPASDGSMWMASGEGLVRFSTSSDQISYIYTRKDGLANECIKAIAEDSRGNIWFSTNAGVSCLTTDKAVVNFDSRDDLPDGNCMPACVATSPDDCICFGSTDGIGIIEPSRILSDTDIPAIVFRSGEDGQTIEYKKNYFSVAFCVPDYAYANSIDYVYRFADLSQEWRECGKTLSFDHLPYGHHTLQVRARRRAQRWDNDIATLNIYVKPPFWRSVTAKALFILLCVLIIALTIALITRRSRRENMQKLQRELLLRGQKINEERLKFYTNITHELRTPLTLILGPLSDLKEDKSLTPAVKGRINNIHANAERLLTLINQLLDFRKTETESKRLTISPGDFSSFVEDQGKRFGAVMENAATAFVLDVEPGIELLFDPDAMTSIISNLLSNAQKYTPEGFVRLGLHREENGSVVLTVTDTGYGMTEEELSHIFDRYYQVSSPHQASGTGIGLALVKNLCKLHHIEIGVESEPGKGSTFSLTLDPAEQYPEANHIEARAQKTEEEPFSPEKEEEQNGSVRVLVVEDNAGICDYISESLSDEFKVSCTHNGREGLQAALHDIPDIVVSDIMMPVMDGIELCKALKNDVRTSHIPIILLTAKQADESRVEGYNVGADSYLVKPFNKDLITSRIRNILNNRKKLAARVSNGEKVEELSNMDNEFLRKFNELVEQNISSEKLDLASVAAGLCMSQSTMYRKVKAVTSLSPVELVRNIRLNKAAELLRTTGLTISEIAWQVGMGSPVYLRDCFKERYGKTPTAYREESKKH